jgi:hypothetical protein
MRSLQGGHLAWLFRGRMKACWVLTCRCKGQWSEVVSGLMNARQKEVNAIESELALDALDVSRLHAIGVD